MLASRGMRTAFRLVSQSSHGGRSIHIPSNAGFRPPGSTAKNVIQQARNIFNRLLYGGVSPANWNSGSVTRGFARGIHLSQPLRSQLSLPARHALSRPFGAPSLPRPPALQRGVAQVGLGTAKNFSTARPIFQSLADNVPVAGRSIYQLDLDTKKKKGSRIQRNRKEKENKARKVKALKESSNFEKSFEKYFAELPESEVTTYLTVPLNPPTSQPLTQNTLQAISETHSSHNIHALRITSLFLRLDQAKVWDHGAHYEAFGVRVRDPSSYGYDPDPNFNSNRAMCTSLSIVFDGWTKEKVRDVIGEAGKGWCTLKEVYRTPNAPSSIGSTRPHTPAPTSGLMMEYDANSQADTEFIMPTLDFSSSFLEAHVPPPFEDREPSPLATGGFSTPMTILEEISLPSTSSANSDFGDAGSDYEWHWSAVQRPTPSRRESESELSNDTGSDRSEWMGVGFSADFMRRGQDMMSNF